MVHGRHDRLSGGLRAPCSEPFSCGCLEQAVSGEDVVSRRKPVQDRGDFPGSANGELGETPLSKACVDALVHGAALVDFLASRALIALAPSRNAGAIVGTRRIAVGLVLAVHWRTVDTDANRCRPPGIVVLVEAAVDEMTVGPPAVAALKFIEHRSHQAAVGAGRIHIDRNGDLPSRRSADLTIVSRPETAIGHLHVARLGIRGGGPRLALFGDLGFVGLGAPFPLGLELFLFGERSFDALFPLPGGSLVRRLDPSIAGVVITVLLLLEVLDQTLGLFQLPPHGLFAAKRTRSGRRTHAQPALSY